MGGLHELQELEANQRVLFIADLSRTISLARFSDLRSAARAVEQLVIDHCQSAVRKVLDYFLLTSTAREIRDLYTVPMAISAGRDLREPRLLVLSVTANQQLRTPTPLSSTCEIAGHGMVREITVMAPEFLDEFASKACDLCAQLVEMGYAWLDAAVDAFVHQAELAIASEMYSLVRGLLPAKADHENLWFACLHREFGFRLVDATVSSAALELIDENAERFGGSAAQFLAELLQTRLPREQLLMQRSHELGTTLEVDVADAGYTRKGDIYAYVLAALYGSTAFTIFPVYATGATTIFALYPAGHADITDQLRRNHSELERLASDVATRLDEYAALFDAEPRSTVAVEPQPVAGQSYSHAEVRSLRELVHQIGDFERALMRVVDAKEGAIRAIPTPSSSHRARSLQSRKETLSATRRLREEVEATRRRDVTEKTLATYSARLHELRDRVWA
jgi:hypothetical protein